MPEHPNRTRNRTRTALLCLIGAAQAAQAQPVLTPPPPSSVAPQAVQDIQNQAMGTILPAGGAPVIPSVGDLFQWGPVFARPHFLYRLLYGSGIQAAPGESETTAIQSISPGILLGLGTHWTLDYTPTLTYYSSHVFHDTLDESAILTWGTAYEDWTLGFSQSYSATDDPLVSTASQTSTTIYDTQFNASYRFNSVMSTDLEVDQNIDSAESLSDTRSWSTLDWLNYQYFERLDFGVGLGAGYDNVSVGPDMTHEQLQGRITWRATDKLSLSVNAGAEDRQFLNSGVSDKISPVYGASVQYQPFDYTTLSLSASRAITVSILQNQVTEVSNLSLVWNQRLFEHFNLNVAGGYGTVDYLAAIDTAPTTRQDKLYSISSRLGWEFLKRATAAVTYQYSKNASTEVGFTYSSSQVGLELGYKF